MANVEVCRAWILNQMGVGQRVWIRTRWRIIKNVHVNETFFSVLRDGCQLAAKFLINNIKIFYHRSSVSSSSITLKSTFFVSQIIITGIPSHSLSRILPLLRLWIRNESREENDLYLWKWQFPIWITYRYYLSIFQ